MADFEKSFRQGLDAAKAAQKARVEIKAVFSELNEQLSQASDGNARLEIMELEEVLRRQNTMLGNIGALGAAFMPRETRRYKALVVTHRSASDFRAREVARWKQDPYGYPCWIIVDAEETACSDRQALEGELAILASSPRVGEAVLAAMSHVSTAGPAPPAPSNEQA